MLLLCVLVLTSTVSADGSISGMYNAGIQLAERAYTGGADQSIQPAVDPNHLKNMVEDALPAALTNDRNVKNKNEQKSGGTVQTPEQKEQK